MIYGKPGSDTGIVSYAARYDNFIGGDWAPPVEGRYFDNTSPIDGETFCAVARSTAADIDMALEAAHRATERWAATSVAQRSDILLKIADRIENSLEPLAVAETWDNGKPIRETLEADLPLAIDHFRYFAGVLRAQEGSISQIDADTVAYHFHEPLGVVGQIIPWNFPILMAAWKLAPALAAGNCVVIKPAEQTPASLLLVVELIADLLPPGVLNVVNGFGVEAGKPLAQSPRVAKIAFTGETTTGRLIMQYASDALIPVTLELGGKSPNIFLPDVLAADDDYLDKAVEGFVMFALNQGEVCTCPSRALIHSSIYDEFLARAIARTEAIVSGHPLDTETMIGAQAGNDQYEKILSYFDIGRAEGARVLTGGEARKVEGLPGGYYIEPTVFEGDNTMRIFQEEIFGPVVAVTRFDTVDEAIRIANDTLYGLGAGVWTRDLNTAHQLGRGIKAGRVWTNCYHAYPAHAAFGGYKKSGFGRENHAMALGHYQQTKNLLVSYSTTKLGDVLMQNRVDITDRAQTLLRRLIEDNGPVLFRHLGDCCDDDGAPVCLPAKKYPIEKADILLGRLSWYTEFWISAEQYECWKDTHLTVDVTKGEAARDSLEAGQGMRFVLRARQLTEAEYAALAAAPPPRTGADRTL